MIRHRTAGILGLVLLAILAAGPVLPDWLLFLFTIALAQGLVALSLMIQMRAGLLSFGQALYYCLGAYAAAAVGRVWHSGDMLLEMCAAALNAIEGSTRASSSMAIE